MRQSETIRALDQEIRKLKDELNQLQRAKRVLKRKSEGVAI
jgi:AmiR/NasT family two-component response regulator